MKTSLPKLRHILTWLDMTKEWDLGPLYLFWILTQVFLVLLHDAKPFYLLSFKNVPFASTFDSKLFRRYTIF